MAAEPTLLREDQLFSDLVGMLSDRGFSEKQINKVRKAFEYARDKHDGQKRKNNENYIVHPVSVAMLVLDLANDINMVLAAILHDTIEDTDATSEELEKLFGRDVRQVVEGVTKLGKFELMSTEERQAENFRRMFLAMANDIRVVFVKLSDRLHNMRTLHHMKPEKQKKTARETLEIFAPLANRMGIGKLRGELEDLSLKYLNAKAYEHIEENISHTRDSRQKTIDYLIEKITEQLQRLHIEAEIYGRVKNIYSIYKKMEKQQKTLADVYDISAIRVIVNTEPECYAVLGVVHNSFSPIPGRFKDYIAMPKRNFYQSLHTTVMGPLARPLEVQIRTRQMHEVAEYGIAAHWKYKETGSQAVEEHAEQKLSWLREMLEMKDEADDASDYVELVKLDLFQDEVFIFTPKGQVVDLPSGSTCVDFAYRIHTEVGHTCTGSVVNGKMVPLDTVLKNGDIIEIVTRKNAHPRLDWLNFVKTQGAKNKIRQWFKYNKREEYEEQGKSQLMEALTKAKYDELAHSGELTTLAKEFNYETPNDLFVAIGYGELNLTRVVNRVNRIQTLNTQEDALKRVKKFQKENYKANTSHHKCSIVGLEGMLFHLARCCTPVPGEDIVGVVTRSRGVMVHRADCQNLNHVNPERKMPLQWSDHAEAQFENHTVRLEVHVIDRVGVLKDLLAKIAETHTNVSNLRVKLREDNTADIELTVDVANAQHVDRVKLALQKLPDVIGVKRQQFRTSQNNGA